MLNKYSNIPLYSQLKELILEKINSGEYSEDSKIPSELEYCEMYDISRPTVRQAITELTNGGILYKVKGRGTFVAKSKSLFDIKRYTGFTDSILDSHEPGKKNIISMKMIPNPETKKVEEAFSNIHSIIQKSGLFKLVYTSLHDDDVMSLSISFIPVEMFPNLIDDIKSMKPSYDIFKGKYALVPFKTKSMLEVVYTDQADARYLHVQPGQPLIKIENTLYSKSGQPVEFILSKYRADKCRLSFEYAK